MAYLVDTSILARLANSADVSHPVAVRAVVELHRRGDVLHVTAQNLIEFRNVATRAATLNGLGLGTAEAEAKSAAFEAAFPLLVETPDIFPAWKTLAGTAAVVGKQVHDARLIAVCEVHQVSHLLTFNVTHFARLASVGGQIRVIDPASI